MVNQWMQNKKLYYIAMRSLGVLSRVANGARLKSSGHLDSKGAVLVFIINSINVNISESSKKKKQMLMLDCALEIIFELYTHSVLSHTIIESLWKPLVGHLSTHMSAETRYASLQIIELFMS